MPRRRSSINPASRAIQSRRPLHQSGPQVRIALDIILQNISSSTEQGGGDTSNNSVATSSVTNQHSRTNPRVNIKAGGSLEAIASVIPKDQLVERSRLKLLCHVCSESMKNRQQIVTKCGHVYCKTCFGQMMRVKKECRKCKKKITPRSHHPIYFA